MKQLILNPVENVPYLVTPKNYYETHGLYVSDKEKNDEVVKNSIIGFSGRTQLNERVKQIYFEWAKILETENLSMRLLSGLHAHIVLFMGLGKIGDKVLLLPEIAGGHYATHNILERLGYDVYDMIPDLDNYCVNQSRTKELIYKIKPDFIFVDRSEGLYYEDFSPLLKDIPNKCCTIFDASQYLTNIMMKDFTSPFDMGFQIMLSTLHKNFPGPQKALVCSKNYNNHWCKILDAMSKYVSSLHIDNILLAGEILKRNKLLTQYSHKMLDNSIAIELLLSDYGLPVIRRTSCEKPHTHHLWIKMDTKDDAFNFYKKMETCNLLVNYRKLPYRLGQGIRMGTSAATLQGVNHDNVSKLAEFIHIIYSTKIISKSIVEQVQDYILSLSPLPYEGSLTELQ